MTDQCNTSTLRSTREESNLVFLLTEFVSKLVDSSPSSVSNALLVFGDIID
jgi:hypothetical protein